VKTSRAGQAEANASLTPRTLMVTSAPIFNRASRSLKNRQSRNCMLCFDGFEGVWC
jgi:hypothetical protein